MVNVSLTKEEIQYILMAVGGYYYWDENRKRFTEKEIKDVDVILHKLSRAVHSKS